MLRERKLQCKREAQNTHVIKCNRENDRSCEKGKDHILLECEAQLGRSGKMFMETCWKGVNVLDV